MQAYRGASGTLCLGCLMAVLAPSAPAAVPEPQAISDRASQRLQFRHAMRAWDRGDRQESDRLAGALRDYPLYPYLIYRRVRHRQARYAEVRDFILAYPDFPHNEGLREHWLPYLASRGRWADFLEIHDPETRSERLLCLAIEARAHTGRSEDALRKQTIPLFLHAKSRHPSCDPAFERLYRSSQADELVWQRIGLALDAGQAGLARHLSRKLSRPLRDGAGRWLRAYHAPRQALRNTADTPDTAQERGILAHAVRRLARRGRLERALEHWRSLSAHYAYTPEEKARMARYLARRALRQDHPAALELLDQAGPDDKQLFEWRLAAALRTENWARIARWTRASPAADTDVHLPQWRYWRARALEAMGHGTEASAVYRELAGERDYYGFLAADRMGLEYHMHHTPLDASRDVLQAVAARPALRRAQEWFLLDERHRALREWRRALRDMPPEELAASAYLTTTWGWHDRAIFALGRAAAYDDLRLRFPVLHETELRAAAERHDLDLGWIFATVRAESAFMTDARSPAGARGLMQLMPAVGRRTARTLGLRNYSTASLLDAPTNIRLGSAYLAGLYRQFHGNIALATGAYNAGPHRIRSWLHRNRCRETDIWVELIPFAETRLHVKRVLFYSAVYDWRLQRSPTRISRRMYAANASSPLCGLQRGTPQVSGTDPEP